MTIFRSLCCSVLALIALAPFVARASDSTIDTSFGWRRTWSGTGTLDERIVAAARAPDGGYVLVGSRLGGAGFYIFLAKLRPDNTYDSNFGDGGRELKDANFTSVTDMTIDTQGRIVVVGATAGALSQSDFGVVRFNANGSEDTSFASDGSTVIGFDRDGAHNRAEDVPLSVTTTPDGSVYVAGVIDDVTSGGTATKRVGVAKLMPDGSNTNTGYGTLPYGRQVFCTEVCENAISVARIVYDAPRNSLVFGGSYELSSTDSDWFIITQNLSTQTYSQRAYAIDQGGNSTYLGDSMYSLAVQADGKTVALGASFGSPSSYVAVLLRAQVSGSVDTSFGNVSGRGIMLPGPARAAYTDLAVDNSGRLVLAGLYGPDRSASVTRLMPSGAIDSNFNGSFLPSLFYAPTTGGSTAYNSRFARVFLDAGRPVLAGEATYSSTDFTDFDLVITRLQSDRIFANGFQ